MNTGRRTIGQSCRVPETAEANPARKVRFVVVQDGGVEERLRDAIGVPPDVGGPVSTSVTTKLGGRSVGTAPVMTTSQP
jgi:hypothetical protein